jgi:hypothetical protein
MRKRNLLVLGALFAVAPLSARPMAAELQSYESDCPYERAAAEALKADQTTVTIVTPAPEGSLLSGGRGSSAFLP